MPRYLILWRATDAPALYEQEEYETREAAMDDLRDFRVKYPWNTYTLVSVDTVEVGTGKRPLDATYTLSIAEQK